MAWFKLLDHNGRLVKEKEVKVRTMGPQFSPNPDFLNRLRDGILHDGILYKWKEYDENFQSDPPVPLEIEVFFNMAEQEDWLRAIPGVLSVERLQDSFIITCPKELQGEIIFKARGARVPVEARLR